MCFDSYNDAVNEEMAMVLAEEAGFATPFAVGLQPWNEPNDGEGISSLLSSGPSSSTPDFSESNYKTADPDTVGLLPASDSREVLEAIKGLTSTVAVSRRMDPERAYRQATQVTSSPKTPLQLLQTAPVVPEHENLADNEVTKAAHILAGQQRLGSFQQERTELLAQALRAFLIAIASNTTPGPERSTAIAKAREAKFWAVAGISLEGVEV
jgi:hypothetical protein